MKLRHLPTCLLLPFAVGTLALTACQPVGDQDPPPLRTLTEGWRFLPGAFEGEATAAGDSGLEGTITDVNPGLPWATQAGLGHSRAGTFYYRFRLPDTLRDYGLHVPPFYGAYRLYLDGRLAGGRGTLSLDGAGQSDYVAGETVALPRREEVLITFEASTYDVYPGGAASGFAVGSYHQLRAKESRVLGLTLFVVGLLTAIGFTVAATSWGSPLARQQRAFGGLAILVAAFVAFNDTQLLASQWIAVPYESIYRARACFLYGSMVLVWVYAAASAEVRSRQVVRRAFVVAMGVALGAALVLPISWSSRVLHWAYVPMAFGSVWILCLAVVRAGWREREVALARISLLALAIGVTAASVAEIGVDQGLGIVTLSSFMAFGVAGGAQFIGRLVTAQGSLLAEARASEVKSQFMARVSHELRTPLHGIKNITKLLTDASADEEQDGLLNALATSCSAMEAIVAGLLDYEEVRRGKLEVQVAPAELMSVIKEAVAIADLQAPSNARTILRDDSGITTVATDATRLRDVVAELIKNAIAFGAGSSPAVMVEQFDDSLRISVRSGGTPLTEAEARQAFLPFQQREGYWQRERGGLGLGLTVARATVEQLGGTLEHRALEEGNAFDITFPLAVLNQGLEGVERRFAVLPEGPLLAERLVLPDDAQVLAKASLAVAGLADVESRTTAEIAAASVKVPKALRILIVEDHPVNRMLALKMVQRWGHAAEAVENGQEAVEAISPGKYDLVLMDLQMPVLDGLSATRLLREHYPADVLPIVALTANTSSADRAACGEVGMQDFLGKPFKSEDLKRVIDTLTADADEKVAHTIQVFVE